MVGSVEQTQHRYRYAYDASGNRTYAHAEQWPVLPLPVPADDLSVRYEYDDANRLVAAALGTVGLGASPDIDPQPSMPPVDERRRTEWSLDRLGNWNGGPGASTWGHRVSGDADLDGDLDPAVETAHTTNLRNELQQVQRVVGGGTPTTGALVYDASGNLVCDGPGATDFFYQYDAWNRLVQVNRRGSLSFSAAGEVTGGAAGDWCVHLTYDALGRLIRVQRPWDATYAAVRAESYFYDGVRRVQEVWREPMPTGIGGDPTSIEEEPEEGGGGPPVYVERTDREYIHSPGYVDEYVCIIGSDNQARYVIQDANFNVMGLLEADGDGLVQYTWDPYGTPLKADVLSGANGWMSRTTLPVCGVFSGLCISRPVARSTPVVVVLRVKDVADRTSPVVRSSTYTYPLRSTCRRTLRGLPSISRSTRMFSLIPSQSNRSCGLHW